MVEPESDPEKIIDYYFEKGLVVFTSAYHLKRGYCCESGCRHCPYGFGKTGTEKGEKITPKEG